jgi:hypothetical protein
MISILLLIALINLRILVQSLVRIQESLHSDFI